MANNKKILIVEDDVYLRDVYELTLKEEGYDVEIAVDGEEGVVKAKDGGYDLILLDVMMPRLDGIGFLKAMKEITPPHPNGKIILLTNLSHDPVVEEAMKLGATNFITKSDVNPNELLQQVKQYLAA